LVLSCGGQPAPPSCPSRRRRRRRPWCCCSCTAPEGAGPPSRLYTWSMTSEGRSFHLERSDPIQPGQPASGRRRHPTGRRWGKVERAQVAAMQAMQLSGIPSAASPQLANSARGPPGVKEAGQRCHGATRALNLNVSLCGPLLRGSAECRLGGGHLLEVFFLLSF